jgi:hypothetical protein
MIRFSHAPQSAIAMRLAMPPLRRLRAPTKLPTLAAPTLWSRVLALLEPAAARERRETRQAAVVLALPRRFR